MKSKKRSATKQRNCLPNFPERAKQIFRVDISKCPNEELTMLEKKKDAL